MKKIVLLSLVFALVVMVGTASAEVWVCPNCGRENTGNFCGDCGMACPSWICPQCGKENQSSFCENCGAAKPAETVDLTGTWRFDMGSNSLLIRFIDDTQFEAASPQGSYARGQYTAENNMLVMKSNGEVVVSSSFSLSGNNLMIEGMTGRRTEERLRFTITNDGHSMDDTLSEGDVLTVECRDPSELQFGDIVVVMYPDRGNTLFIKRLIGLPDDKVELRDGYLYINDEYIDEPYVNDDYRTGPANRLKPCLVPGASYFVMGDHRNNSNDSRFAGPLPEEMMVGVVVESAGRTFGQ